MQSRRSAISSPNRGHEASSSWPSRLASSMHILRTSTALFLCVETAKWGLLVAGVEAIAADIYRVCSDVGTWRIDHITDVWGTIIFPVKGVMHDAMCCMYSAGPEVLLAAHAVQTRRVFSVWELRQALASLPGPSPEHPVSLTHLQMMGHIIYVAFPDPQQVSEITLLYAAPPPVEDPSDEQTLMELSDLVEEMAITDQVNTGDFKAFKDELTRGATKRMLARRKQAQDRASASKKLRKRKALLRQRVKRKKKTSARKGIDHRKRKAAETPEAASSSTPLAVLVAPDPAPVDAMNAGGGKVQRQMSVGAPRAVGGWEVCEVPGGWLRFNEQLGRLDAHCSCHGSSKCKMDRSLAKAPVALLVSWLKAPSKHRKHHQNLKFVLSAADQRETRLQGSALAGQVERTPF